MNLHLVVWDVNTVYPKDRWGVLVTSRTLAREGRGPSISWGHPMGLERWKPTTRDAPASIGWDHTCAWFKRPWGSSWDDPWGSTDVDVMLLGFTITTLKVLCSQEICETFCIPLGYDLEDRISFRIPNMFCEPWIALVFLHIYASSVAASWIAISAVGWMPHRPPPRRGKVDQSHVHNNNILLCEALSHDDVEHECASCSTFWLCLVVSTLVLCGQAMSSLHGKEDAALGIFAAWTIQCNVQPCTCIYLLMLCYLVIIHLGIVKIHLPQSAFLDCAAADDVDQQTLFPKVDYQHVKMSDLERYLELVIDFYRLSPEGGSFVILCTQCI